MDFNARHAFGFDEPGYITLYKGDEEEIKEWARAVWPPKALYNLTFGFFTPSKMDECITELPPSITPVKLTWAEVQDHDDRMLPHDRVHDYVLSILQEKEKAAHPSDFQGMPAEWIERDLAVYKKLTAQNRYGEKSIYTFIDGNENRYQWATDTKNYEVGQFVRLKMKVRAHSVIDNVKTTVVWYCKEI
jgi:hypothetical protein